MSQPDTAATFWKDQNGRVLKIDPRESATAAQAGWRPATDAEIGEAYKRKEAGTLTGQVKTAAEGVAAGAMDAALAVPHLITAAGSKLLGEQDPLARFSGRQFLEDVAAVGGELGSGGDRSAEAVGREYGQNQRRRAEVNPGTAGVSGLAGTVLGSGGISGLGRAAGQGVAAGIGKGIVSRLAGAAAAGATEGGLINLAGEQDRAYLEQRQLTAEAALASAGVGALLGGGLGLVAKGGSEVFGAAKTRIAGALEQRALGAGEEAGASRAASAAALGEADEGAVRKVLRTGDDHINAQGSRVLREEPLPGFAENVRRAVKGENVSELRAAAHSEATEQLTTEMQRAVATANDMGDEVFVRAVKRGHVEANFAKSAPAADAVARTTEVAGNILRDLDSAIADASSFGKPSDVLLGLRKQVAKQAAEIATTEAPADAYIAMDQIRRDLLKTSRSFADSAAKVGNVDRAANMQALAEKVGEHYDGTWKFLMDSGTWGAQGAAQEEVNNAAVKFIEAKRFAFPRFAEKVGENYAGPGRFLPVYEVNDAKIANLVTQFGTPQGAFAERRFAQYLDAAKSFSEAVGNAYELPAELGSKMAELKAGAEAVKKTFADVGQKVGALNQTETFMHAVKGESGGGLQKAILGQVAGGPIGAAIGFGADAALNPAKFLAQRIRIEQMAERAQSLIGKSLDGLFAPVAEGASKLPAIAEKVKAGARGLAQATAAAAVPTTLAVFQGKHDSPEAAYRKRAEDLFTAAQDMGGPIRDAIGRSFGEAAAHEPEALAAMTMSATNGVNYLLSRLPSPLFDPKTLTPLTSRPVPSKAEIQQFADVWTAVYKPAAVIADIPHGTVSQEQLDAIRNVYPSLFSWMQEEAWSRIQKADEKGRPLSLRATAILDTMLDLNGAGEPTYAPAFGAKYGPRMGDIPTQPPPRARGSVSAGIVGKSYRTRTSMMLGE